MSLRSTPLDLWCARCLGEGAPLAGRAALEAFQKERLRALVARAAQDSPLYASRLRGREGAPLEELPFTYPSDLAGREGDFLTVSQSEVARIVTLATSGSTGPPKRLCFTYADLAATREFFRVGLTAFTPPGSRVTVLFRGDRPGSVGALLREALGELGCAVEVGGVGEDPRKTAARIDAFNPRVVVGMPEALLRVARVACHVPEAVLASGDMFPPALRRRIARLWPGEIFDHYGLTEVGWGMALECGAHEGGHLREGEVLTEVVSPGGHPVPSGSWGEVVITTLTRPTFPLIRYRTGDEGRLIPGPCPCGSPLRRLEVRGRLGTAEAPGLYDVAEILWGVRDIRDFRVGREGPPRRGRRVIEVEGEGPPPEDRIRKALAPLREEWSGAELRLTSLPFSGPRPPKRGWEAF